MMQGEDTVDIEKSNIDELRRRMKDLVTPEMYEDDNVFERFLRARNQNLDAAEAMLKKHVKWRKVTRVDTIIQQYKQQEVLAKYDPLSRIAFDKEGAPVIYIAFGNIDARGGYKTTNKSDVFKYFVAHLEGFVAEMKLKSNELATPITQWVLILDYHNFTYANATFKPGIENLIYMISMYEANYPERLKAAYLINGSIAFQIIYAIVKPFVSGTIFKKLHLHGADFQNGLLKIIDADQLPAFLGGNRTDPDGNPRCEQTVNFGGIISEHYIIAARNRKLSEELDARLMIVNRFSKSRIEVEVTHPGSTIEWQFTVKNENIDFSVLYKGHREQDDTEEEEVIPQHRIETVATSEKGMSFCEKAGVYLLEFDNSFSWMHSKHIYYKVTVIKPTNERFHFKTEDNSDGFKRTLTC